LWRPEKGDDKKPTIPRVVLRNTKCDENISLKNSGVLDTRGVFTAHPFRNRKSPTSAGKYNVRIEK
jgi:hypothetical protein